MKNQNVMYVNLGDLLLQAVKSLEFGSVLAINKEEVFGLRDKILKIFYKNYELRDYSGELVIADRITGEIVRDRFYNTLSLCQVLKKIAKQVYPLLGLEKEVRCLPSEQEFTRYMRKSGISKNSPVRRKLFQEWVHAHQNNQVRRASEYWF